MSNVPEWATFTTAAAAYFLFLLIMRANPRVLHTQGAKAPLPTTNVDALPKVGQFCQVGSRESGVTNARDTHDARQRHRGCLPFHPRDFHASSHPERLN
jgi:hypothetical protein